MTVKDLRAILENFDEDSEIDIYELHKAINEEYEDRQRKLEELEEESLTTAWQQDVIDMYRFER